MRKGEKDKGGIMTMQACARHLSCPVLSCPVLSCLSQNLFKKKQIAYSDRSCEAIVEIDSPCKFFGFWSTLQIPWHRWIPAGHPQGSFEGWQHYVGHMWAMCCEFGNMP